MQAIGLLRKTPRLLVAFISKDASLGGFTALVSVPEIFAEFWKYKTGNSQWSQPTQSCRCRSAASGQKRAFSFYLLQGNWSS